MPSLRVNLGSRSYDIRIGSRDTSNLGEWAAGLTAGQSCCVITDNNLHNHQHLAAVLASLGKADFRPEMVVLPAGEEQKCLSSLSFLYDRLVEYRTDRKTLIVALGGGVIGDLAGFAAATFNRGLLLVIVPTTLLAMVDSSVGGKVGINHPQGKNLIGAFHQPVGVWIDTHFLSTLPDREFRSGLAEVVKYGVILDAEFFAWLEKHTAEILGHEPQVLEFLINRCCQLKAHVVEQDEFETKGLRAILNYGHTFAHAFEKVAGYGTLLHGEAVSMGIVCASKLAERLGRIDSRITERQAALFDVLQLPVQPVKSWDVEKIMAAMFLDKKTHANQLRFVLPKSIGEVETGIVVSETLVREVLASCMCGEN
jgi:3-dehydroquinate synthase